MPIPLEGHSMVPLGLGQAILGGIDDNAAFQTKIYHVTCSNQLCDITTLSKELSTPKHYFVAIPIPDDVSDCISASTLLYVCFKNCRRATCFWLVKKFSLQENPLYIYHVMTAGKDV